MSQLQIFATEQKTCCRNKITWPNFWKTLKIQIHKTIATSSVILTTYSEMIVFIYRKKKTLIYKSVLHKTGEVRIWLDQKTFIRHIMNSFSLDIEIILRAYFRQKWMYDYIRNIWDLSVVSIYSEVQIHFPPVLHRERSDHLISPSEHYEYKAQHKMFHCIWTLSIWRLFGVTLTNSLARW